MDTIELDKMMKLNLGCGQDIRDGWINLDERNIKGIDIVHKIVPGKLLPLLEHSFDLVLCQDIIEHFKQVDTVKLLMEVHRILKIGGIIKISVPYIPVILEMYKKVSIERFNELLFGKQDYEGNCHYRCFDRDSLVKSLRASGFNTMLKTYTVKRTLFAEAVK